MKFLKIFEEFSVPDEDLNWRQFRSWLYSHDFKSHDGEDELEKKFKEVSNDSDMISQEKADAICDYVEDNWGLEAGYSDAYLYLKNIFDG